MIDAWSGPPPTPQQFPANEPNGIRKLLDKIKALELLVKESTSNLLGTAGIRLTQAGMFIDSSLTVGGTETVNGPLVVHGTADFDGATSIGGALEVVGTLSLPAGIIDNAALNSPVSAATAHDDSAATAFAVTTTHTTQAGATVTVPAGYTQALVFTVGQASAVNTSGTDDTLYVSSWIDAVVLPGWAAAQDVPPGALGGAACAGTKLLTGLTGGGTFVVRTKVFSGYLTWPGHAANSCNVDATVVFLR